ncbi:MAG: FAD-dependent oxidoreductase [Planctomycetes bacterium]|nr:FAD-dependent oxidoreductase [Planctomycetota bacterium]
MSARPRIVVLGGGFGGLESLFYLKQQLGDRADLTLVTNKPYFLFKPNTIYIPFGEPPEKYEVDLKSPLNKQGIRLLEATVHQIDRDSKTVETTAGRVEYDHLVVATGARMCIDEIPGMAAHAITVWTPDDMLTLRDRITRIIENARHREHSRILFLVPPNNRCSGPLYEMVCMLDTHLRRHHARDHVTLTFATKEGAFIEAFGPRLNSVVAEEFAERHITGHIDHVVTEILPQSVRFQNSSELPYDLLISFPPYAAASHFSGLPTDDRGFVTVDPSSRRVAGSDSVYAVGDTADFPIKQAFLALLQGDAAGDHIAAEILGRNPDVDFVPTSMCVMEQFDKAVFAQVPLKYTGDSSHPVEVNVTDSDHYKVGVSPLWRVGKTALGYYLPWRFGSGKPFHAGLPWKVMELGLKIMSQTMAE